MALDLRDRAALAREWFRSRDDYRKLRRAFQVQDATLNPRERLLGVISELGDFPLSTRLRVSVVRDAVQAFTPTGFRLHADHSICQIVGNGPTDPGALVLGGTLRARGDLACTIVRTVVPEARGAIHNYLKAEDQFRGEALAPTILRQSFLYFDRIGVEQVLVHAGLETGKYYWARCGFDFMYPGERDQVRQWFEFLLPRLGHANIDLTQVTAAYHLAVVGKQADLTTTMDAIFNAARPLFLDAQVALASYRQVWDDNGLDYGADVPLGKALFLTYPAMWWGRMDLAMTSPQRTVFEEYAQSRIKILAR